MAKPNWTLSLEQVLKRPTIKLSKISQKTGNEYNAEVIERVVLTLAGSPEVGDGFVKYPIADTKTKLEYTIKVEEKILSDLNFGQHLLFKNITGGALKSGGWYKADSVEKYDKNT